MILQAGTKAPEFSLENQFGEIVNLSSLLAKGPVTLVFFPFAFSNICQGELCELRDNISMFASTSSQLVGISVDSKYSLRAWAEAQNYDFLLLQDFWPHGVTAQSYGSFLPDKGFANRATFVIDANGIIKTSFVTAPGEARPLDIYRDALATL